MSVNAKIERNTIIVKPNLSGSELSDNLTALDSLAGTGIISKTAASAWAVRTITGTENQVTVTNGDGVSGNPTLSLSQDIHTGATPVFEGLSLSKSYNTNGVIQLSAINSNASTADSFFTAKLAGENGGRGLNILFVPSLATFPSTAYRDTFILKPVNDSMKIMFSTSSYDPVLTMCFSGGRRISIDRGTSNPTAALHIRAGSNTANQGAPLKIDAGTNLATPEAGAIENDGTHIYWTNASGVRYQLDQQAGGGSGTVNSGVAGTLSLYPSTGTTVDDVYVQNSQNISVAIAAQASRSAGLTYTIPNPGDAETAATFALATGIEGGQKFIGGRSAGQNAAVQSTNHSTRGLINLLDNTTVGSETTLVSGYTPQDAQLQIGKTGASAKTGGLAILGYQSGNAELGRISFINEALGTTNKEAFFIQARRGGTYGFINFYYHNGTTFTQLGACGDGVWTFGNTSLTNVATVTIANITNKPNLNLFGTTVSSPSAGYVWYDSTQKTLRYGTTLATTTGSVGQIYSATADSAAITNTVTETNFDKNKSLAANGLVAGKSIPIFFGGVISDDASAAGTAILKIKFGTTVIATSPTITLSNALSNNGFFLSGSITCRTTGASGTVVFDGFVIIHDKAYAITSAGAVTVDTTSAQTLRVSWTWGTADTDNTVKSQTVLFWNGD